MIVREQYTFTGLENLPNPFWEKFFSMSVVGNTYEILRKTEGYETIMVYHQEPIIEVQNIEHIIDGEAQIIPTEVITGYNNIGVEHTHDLIMSNTEYEYYTNQPFFDVCAEYTNPKVLSIGFGIGLILDEMDNQGADLTIIEKHQEVVDLETRDLSNYNIIIADINEYDLSQLSDFDVIFTDITDSLLVDEALKSKLKEGGQLVKWERRNIES